MPGALERGLRQGTVTFDAVKGTVMTIRIREYYNIVVQKCGRRVADQIDSMVVGLPGWSKNKHWERAAEAAQSGKDPVAVLRRMGL